MAPPWLAASRAGIYSSLAFFAAALALVYTGRVELHSWLALSGALTLFPASVWVAYAASASRGAASTRGYTVASTVAVASIVAGGFVGSRSMDAGAVLLGAGLLLASAAGLIVLPTVRRGEARLSVALGSLAALSGGVYSLLYVVLVGIPGGIPLGLAAGLIASFPVPLIHAVTVHSLPSTFRDKPLRQAALAGGALSLAMPVAFLASERAGSLLLAFFLAVYVLSARLYRAPSYAGVARTFKSPAARSGALFFAYSHTLSLAYTLTAAAVAAAHASGLIGGGLQLIHAIAAGFVALHVYIHVPMMLPTILALPAARRFNLALASVLLAAASGLAWSISRTIALAAASAALLLVVAASFKPPRARGSKPGRV